jgi:hypothetical protein
MSVVVFAVCPVLAYGLVVWANIGHRTDDHG